MFRLNVDYKEKRHWFSRSVKAFAVFNMLIVRVSYKILSWRGEHIIGASLSEPHTIVVYGTTCINQPCPSHSRDTDTLHLPTLPRRHATLMWTVQCVVVIVTRLRTLTMGKRKAETPTQRTVRLEWEIDQRTSSYLRFLVGVAMHPWVSCTSVFLPSYFTQTLFHSFLHKHNTCSPHSGHLRTDNAYRCA